MSKDERGYMYTRMNELGIKVNTRVHSLISLPVGDGNYQRPLREATREELQTALLWFEEFPKNNSGRKKAVEKQLKSLPEESLIEFSITDFQQLHFTF